MTELASIVGQLLGALLYTNFGEWAFHRYILHGLGANPKSFWAYHYLEHHAKCSMQHMVDQEYLKPIHWTWNTRTKEIVVLLGIVLVHAPLFWVSPIFISAIIASIIFYYLLHCRSHQDPIWAKRYLPWHYEHHIYEQLGGNWCISLPLCDHIFGTRISSKNVRGRALRI